jgi:hypothetical protein
MHHHFGLPLAFAASLLGASLLPAQSLTTLFASNNGGSAGGGNFFDINVKNPAGIIVTALDQNTSATASSAVGIAVFTTPTTYAGKETNLALWTQVATGTGVSAGLNLPSAIDTYDFYLPFGTYGIAIVGGFTGGPANIALRYTNLVATPPNNFYTNADLDLTAGTAMNVPWTGSVIAGRVWNGTIYYCGGGNGVASYGRFGKGCVGTNAKAPALAASTGSLPKINAAFSLSLTDLPTAGGPVVVALGGSKTIWGALPLPFDLAVISMPGCSALCDPLVTFNVTNTAGTASLTLPIPNSAALLMATFYNQAYVIDNGANPLGLTASNGGEGVIGK